MIYPKQPATDAEAVACAQHLTNLHGTPYGAYKSAPGPNGSHYCALQPQEAVDFMETGWTLVESEPNPANL